MSYVTNHIANQNAIIQEQQRKLQEAQDAAERERIQRFIDSQTTQLNNYAANYGVCPQCGRQH